MSKGQKKADQAPIKDLLKEKDVFLTTSERFYEYFLRHTRTLAVIGSAAALIVIGLALFYNYRQSAENKAAAAYEEALELMTAAGDLKAASARMEQVRRERAGLKAARMASFTLIGLYSFEKDYEKAIAISEEMLRTLTPAEMSLKPLMLHNLAGLYETAKNYDRAAAAYEAFLKTDALQEDMKVDVLLSLGRLKSALGDKAGAISIYEGLLAEFPRAALAYLANYKLAELKGEPTAFPMPAMLPDILAAAEEAAAVTTGVAAAVETDEQAAEEAAGGETAAPAADLKSN
ncbi:MAG: tetratricopeptide repeat protein [Candidatus Adiutrix sp.]|jgi:predicted negative regulator of RcsB-dependent stress response|nr:tetratricopeptide repeat protein [Candidatus Adiutrix sp.]